MDMKHHNCNGTARLAAIVLLRLSRTRSERTDPLSQTVPCLRTCLAPLFEKF